MLLDKMPGLRHSSVRALAIRRSQLFYKSGLIAQPQAVRIFFVPEWEDFLSSPEWSSEIRGPRASKHACFLATHLWHGIAADSERDGNGAVTGASCI